MDDSSRGVVNTDITHSDDSRTYRFEPEPLKQGVQRFIERVVETGRLPGAPAAHRRVADYIEYAQAIVNSTTTVSEAVTSRDLQYFAWGLPLFDGERPRDVDLDAKDIQNLTVLSKCLPSIVENVANYHVSATYHAGKLLFIAACNPRAIEWILTAAIMVQRGLDQKIIELLLDRKDRFLEAMHKDMANQDKGGLSGISPEVISFSATLERLIVNTVTSMKSLNLGELGGELRIDGPLPERFDLDHYVTSDETLHSIAREAELLGCQFHDAVLLVRPEEADNGKRKALRSDTSVIARSTGTDRLRRIDAFKTAPGTSRYQVINSGPTGRVPHGRLVSGLVHTLLSQSLPLGQRERPLTALSQPARVAFALEIDLTTGIGTILTEDDDPKGLLECPGISLEGDLPEPASIRRNDELWKNINLQDLEYADFNDVALSTTRNWDSIVHTFLVVKGWWSSKHLIRDMPILLFVPHHSSYFHAMARIGLTILLLEQNTGCVITTNRLFDALRHLTNLGGTHDPMTYEAATYAAQGPGGTLVHDIVGFSDSPWPRNPNLSYRWLQGKFHGVPEVALFAHGCEWCKYISIPPFDLAKAIAGSNPTRSSVTIYADSTDGHTLSCALVSPSRRIRSLPLVRVLVGLMLARIQQNKSCNHSQSDGTAYVDDHDVHVLPWNVIEDHYYGRAEINESDNVLIAGVEDSKLCQIMALAVSKEVTAIDTTGCVVCAFDHSNHVINSRFIARDQT